MTTTYSPLTTSKTSFQPKRGQKPGVQIFVFRSDDMMIVMRLQTYTATKHKQRRRREAHEFNEAGPPCSGSNALLWFCATPLAFCAVKPMKIHC